jgi:hypothetical protein
VPDHETWYTENHMDETELLRQAGLDPEWLHEYLTESNKIDPQAGSAEPGSTLYDAHRAAVLYAIKMASEDRYALPNAVHEILLPGNPLAGVLRVHEAKIGLNNLLEAKFVPHFMWKWNRLAQATIDSLRTDDDSIDPDEKIAQIWGLHCELENIRPYELYNGKVGRVLMINHALLVDIDPWIIPCAIGREDYFDMIRYHASAKWGLYPPDAYGEDFSLT